MTEKRKPSEGTTFGDRVWWAWLRHQMRHPRDRMKQEDLGALVAKAMNREPFKQGTVSKWFTESEPDLRTVEAIARALDVSVGWLAFEEGDPPSNPAMPIPMPRPKREP